MKQLALLLLSLALSTPLAAASLADTLDRLERQGREAPDRALRALDLLPLTAPKDVFQRRITQGLIYAANGRAQEARSIAEALQQADPALHGDAGLVAADMVLAQLAQVEAKPDRAASHTQAGLQRLELSCEPPTSACDWRRQWQLQMLASGAARARGLEDEARRMAQAALHTAKSGKDAYRQTVSLVGLAAQAIHAEQLDQADRLLRQARGLADQTNEPSLKVRVLMFTSQLQGARNDSVGMQGHLREALALAQSAHLTRHAVTILINLSDLELKAHRPAQAIQALEQAQSSMSALKDKRIEATLKHNLGMARLALGQVAAGKRDIEAGLTLWEGSGAREELASSLQEYSEALAKAGDTAGALSAYHRERKLKNEALAADREASLSALHSRFNKDAQKREIELQVRENAVQKALLDNHQARQRLWAWLAVVALLIMVILILLLRRMRQTQRLLRRRQDDLRVQSEQDSLTGLANRRSLHRSIQAAQGDAGEYRGGLLLIDLDHFKRINDEHGHGAGDVVLQEVARRLKALIGPADVVGRWGGEEFAIHLAQATPKRTAEVADAVLQAIGGRPVLLPSVALRVTASVGFGTYPLPQAALHVAWEQALNLADMALYLAKSQGRNQALGLAAVQAETPEALAEIEADFESATRLGKAQLQSLAGPALHNGGHAPA
ncbi:diguanylate cyclase [Ideonella sp.]|jgi:diguanylate cyclase (GGDEF)-like protein|uniref:diguanylate cyclase n=1 Tax=Ideonella sp. TaxID=1929293 RepID=UPI0037BEAA12